MANTILNAANLYAKGFQDVLNRRQQWLDKYKEVQARMKEVADDLNANAEYKQQFFVDTSHAFNEDINGTCENIPSLTFRSGQMPLMVTFKNALHEKKEYVEDGFHLTFTPTVTGEILVLLLPHHTSLSTEKPEYVNLAVLESPLLITMDLVNEILEKGIQMAFYSSFTGMVELQKREITQEQKPNPKQYAPIGFKRYDSTEKVK